MSEPSRRCWSWKGPPHCTVVDFSSDENLLYIPDDNLLSNGLVLKYYCYLVLVELLTGYQLTKPYKYLYKYIYIYIYTYALFIQNMYHCVVVTVVHFFIKTVCSVKFEVVLG